MGRDRSPLRHLGRHTAPPCLPNNPPLSSGPGCGSLVQQGTAWAGLQFPPPLKEKRERPSQGRGLRLWEGGLHVFRLWLPGSSLLCLCLSRPQTPLVFPPSLPLPVPSLLLQLGLDWRKRRVNHLSLTPSPCLLRALQARAEALWAAGGAHLGEPPRGTAFSQSPTAGPSFTAPLSAAPTRFLFPFLGCLVRGGACAL